MSEARVATSTVDGLSAQAAILASAPAADNSNFAPYTTEAIRIRRPITVGAKRLFDVVAATLALILFAPLMGVIYVLVRRDGGPGIFVQERLGLNGDVFQCYKFRSMVPNAEDMLKNLIFGSEQMRVTWETDRKLQNDPRITTLGVFLRSKSLDELPQLINIIKGDMSLVGPRPIVLDEKVKYGASFAYYTQVRPGLTGLWQVSGRNDVSYDERVRLDADYVANWTLVRDLDIVIKTVGVVINGRGAR